MKRKKRPCLCPVCCCCWCWGAVLIAMGANLLVDNGTLIAQALGVPESVIALTFVALGTSLPELVTAITSLIKGHSDLSLGNVGRRQRVQPGAGQRRVGRAGPLHGAHRAPRSSA